MVDRTLFRSRASLAVGFVLAAAGLAGCEQVAQDMVASEHRAEAARLEAEGNPDFADPKLQAIVRQFEADYARFGRDTDALKADAPTICRIAPEDAYKALKGIDYAEQQRLLAETGTVSVTDLDSLEIRVVSGDCGPAGIEGPAEIVGSSRTVARYGQGDNAFVIVTDMVERIRATWQDGARVGPVRNIMVLRSATFKAGADGGLEAQKHDWKHLEEMADAPSANYIYSAEGPGYETESVVQFSRNREIGLFGVSVTERRADGTAHQRSYSGRELISEMAMKDGRPHGWLVVHPRVYQGTQLPGSRTCYQHGEVVKATTCPAD